MLAKRPDEILDEAPGDQNVAESFRGKKVSKVGKSLVRQMSRVGRVAPFSGAKPVEEQDHVVLIVEVTCDRLHDDGLAETASGMKQ